jgi:hypothetical protein
MRQILFYSFIVIITLTFGCDKDDTQNCKTIANLVGTWRSNVSTNSLTFQKNGEYIDSVFDDRNFNSIAYIISGNYNLLNGFIELSDLKFTYLRDMTGISTFIFCFSKYNFEIIDNSLIMTETGIFTPNGHSGDMLYGSWESDRIIIAYDTRQDTNFLSGKQIMQYNFSEGSTDYFIIYKNTYGTMQDSTKDGPLTYYMENQKIFCTCWTEPFAYLTSGKLITVDFEVRNYNKVN